MADQSTELAALLALGDDLIDAERYEDAIAHFTVLVDRFPDDPHVTMHLAGAYDSAGQEDRAVGPYRAALAAGLPEEENVRTRIQLASTLRNLGELDEAIQILSQLCAELPEHRAARAFFALALTSAGQADRAVSELLDLLLTNPGPVEAYQRSLRWYADDLLA
jgi:Flp pilus assembly protein TadD